MRGLGSGSSLFVIFSEVFCYRLHIKLLSWSILTRFQRRRRSIPGSWPGPKADPVFVIDK